MNAAVDNDILLKGACYGLLLNVIESIPSTVKNITVLGAARFVLQSRLRKTNLVKNPELALRLLERVFAEAAVLEPNDVELTLAAQLESYAQSANVRLDAGESQLCALVMSRNLKYLVTGDKRAIRALNTVLLDRPSERDFLIGKVLCLEQLLLRLSRTMKPGDIRRAICGEPSIDNALSICFSCSSPELIDTDWSAGLHSYIRDLRGNVVPSLLVE